MIMETAVTRGFVREKICSEKQFENLKVRVKR